MRHLAALALLAAVSCVPARAETIVARDEYRKCLILAKTKPEDGWEEALAWQSLGGGEAARHCGAVALIGLGKHDEAAKRLETLADESRRGPEVKAEMLAQAAQAWILTGNLVRADAALRTALKVMPGHPDIVLDHAVTLGQLNRFDEAEARLAEVLKAQPNRIEALALRASALRYLDRLAEARQDVERALELDPLYPDALLERGMLHRLDGKDAMARRDWLRVIEILPESAAADHARRNIEMLDVKIR